MQTRQYRSPEVILVEKHYDEAADMWSVGCILAQLLLRANNNLKASNSDVTKNYRQFLAGASCNPLSPCASDDGSEGSDDETISLSSRDQLLLILRLLGHQSDEDLSFITDLNAINYVNSLQAQSGKS